ncbi:hypothetical protein EAF04_009382 [Stromatinia cepivora]|nr:hypothetical protein EAF04_009382 [Stromatinia cepivora]
MKQNQQNSNSRSSSRPSTQHDVQGDVAQEQIATDLQGDVVAVPRKEVQFISDLPFYDNFKMFFEKGSKPVEESGKPHQFTVPSDALLNEALRKAGMAPGSKVTIHSSWDADYVHDDIKELLQKIPDRSTLRMKRDLMINAPGSCGSSLGLAIAIINAICQMQDDPNSQANARGETNKTQVETISYYSATPTVLIITSTSPLVAEHWRNLQVLSETRNTKVAARGIKVEVACAAYGGVRTLDAFMRDATISPAKLKYVVFDDVHTFLKGDAFQNGWEKQLTGTNSILEHIKNKCRYQPMRILISPHDTMSMEGVDHFLGPTVGETQIIKLHNVGESLPGDANTRILHHVSVREGRPESDMENLWGDIDTIIESSKGCIQHLFADPNESRRRTTSIEPLKDIKGRNIIPVQAGLSLYHHQINLLMGPQGKREIRDLQPFALPVEIFLVTDVASAGLNSDADLSKYFLDRCNHVGRDGRQGYHLIYYFPDDEDNKLLAPAIKKLLEDKNNQTVPQVILDDAADELDNNSQQSDPGFAAQGNGPWW